MSDQNYTVLPNDESNPIRIRVTYKNWRGEISERVIEPRRLLFGSNQWHKEPQWIMEAFDLGKQAMRYFAMKDFLSVEVNCD